MKRLLFVCTICILTIGCQNDYKNKQNLYNYIPDDATSILSIPNFNRFISKYENNGFLRELEQFKSVALFDSLVSPLKILKPKTEVLICTNKESVTFISKYNPELFQADSIPNSITTKLEPYLSYVYKTSIEDNIFFHSIKDSVFLASNSLDQLKLSLDREHNNTIEEYFKTADKEKTTSMFWRANNGIPNLINFLEDNKSNLSQDYVLDIEIDPNELYITGVTKSSDSTQSLINVFKQTIPQENNLANVAPNNITQLLSLTFDDFSTFKKNLNRFNDVEIDSMSLNPFDFASEVGTFAVNNKKAYAFYAIDPELAEEVFDASEFIEGFRDTKIMKTQNSNLFSNNLSPFISDSNSEYYVRLDEFFVFSDDLYFLKIIISDFQNNNTLKNSDVYIQIKETLSDESSLLFLSNSTRLNSVLNSSFTETKTLDLKNYKLSALQYIYDTNFAHVNGIIKTTSNKRRSNSVSESFNALINAEILSPPQIVKNHRTRQKEIIVQDINNALYLISNKGTVLWKKQLHGPILGKVQQIDTYKNGRLQLVFATPNRVYVLDRNGNDVNAFPLKFNDEITQPLSVFDYDKKKDYRLLVTQNKSLLMYDKHGKNVNGFKFGKANNSISSQPKHFRIGRKDYIVFSEGERLQVIDRVGKTRINVKDKISFSGNPIYLYKNQFTTSTRDGNLVQINTKGQTSYTNLNLNKEHNLTSTSKTLVTLNDNRLKIRTNSVELDLGDYTPPQIFYINDKIYVSTTDLQTKKVYLFDSQAKTIPNFPVYGNSVIALDNIDKDSSLELAVKGDDKAIIVYEIN